MSCCCTKILELCKVNSCGDINTGILATDTGIHKLVVDFLNVQLQVDAEINIGDEIIFPASTLNESYKFTGYIIGPDGEKMTLTKDAVDYDCLSFETVIAYQTN